MGRPVRLDRKLVSKIAEKEGKDDTNIVKRVSGFASRHKVQSEVALIVEAEKHGIRTQTAMGKLPAHQQAQVHTFLNTNLKKRTVPVDRRRDRGTIPRTKSTNENGDYNDDNIPNALYQAIPTDAYATMFILENSVRFFVQNNLARYFGPQWWDEVVKRKALQSIVTEVERRRTKEKDHWYHSKRGAHEVFYTDFGHLLEIIRSFDTELGCFFRKGAEKTLLGNLEYLIPTRNVIAHNNPITKDDFNRLTLHAKEWFKYIRSVSNKVGGQT